MSKQIQMIDIDSDNNNCIYLYEVTDENEIIFRTRNNIDNLQTERFVVDKGMVYTNLFMFPLEYLKRVLKWKIKKE